MPDAGAEPLDPEMQESEPLILSVDSSGAFYLNVGDDEEQPREPAQILQLATSVINSKPKVPVLVNADESVAYGRVISGMVLLQQAGARGKSGSSPTPPRLIQLKSSKQRAHPAR